MHRVRIRRATQHDQPALDQVFTGLSAESRRRRYLAPVEQLTAPAREALLAVDDDRHVVLIAEVGPRRRLTAIGLARYVVDGHGEAEVAYEVVDAWQGRGVGTRLLRSLAATARDHGIERLHGTVLRDNEASLSLLRRVLFDLEVRGLGPQVEFTAWLEPQPLRVDDLLGDLQVA
jgi:RimJ/RimL family protein N-acetyltransferase